MTILGLRDMLREKDDTLLIYSNNLSKLHTSLQSTSQREAKLQGDLEILQTQLTDAKTRL
jgi:hypothetical protein